MNLESWSYYNRWIYGLLGVIMQRGPNGLQKFNKNYALFWAFVPNHHAVWRNAKWRDFLNFFIISIRTQ